MLNINVIWILVPINFRMLSLYLLWNAVDGNAFVEIYNKQAELC